MEFYIFVFFFRFTVYKEDINVKLYWIFLMVNVFILFKGWIDILGFGLVQKELRYVEIFMLPFVVLEIIALPFYFFNSKL
jgi:hypothetical protein